MDIVHYTPLDIVREMNKFMGLKQDQSSVTNNQWAPAVDVIEKKDSYLIIADLPGTHKDAIEVSMDNGALTIKGERKEEHKTEDTSYSKTERMYGSFYRRFSLPDTADLEKIKATFEDGVLKLNILKKEQSKPKRIEIIHNR